MLYEVITAGMILYCLIIGFASLFTGFLIGRIYGLKKANKKMIRMYLDEGIIKPEQLRIIDTSKI